MKKDVCVTSGVGSRAVSVLAIALGVMSLLGAPAAEAGKVRIPNKCSIVKNAEVSPVIGEIIKVPAQTGPTQDASHEGAQSTSCVFEGESGQVIVMVLSFATADQATAALDADVESMRADEFATPTVEDEAGLGEQAYWVKTEQTSAYFAKSGAKIAAVTITWSDLAMDQSKPLLLKLTQTVLASG